MTQDEIIEQLRGMAKYPTVTLPRDCEALRMAADLLAQPDYTITQTGVGIGQRAEEAYEAAKERGWEGLSDDCLMQNAQPDPNKETTAMFDKGRKWTKSKEPGHAPVATLDDLEQEIYENTQEFVSLNVMKWLLNRLNTTPLQPKEPKQKPVAWICKTHKRSGIVRFSWETFGEVTPLYTTPPQHKPLTHEQRVDLLTKFEPHKNKWEAPAILIDMVEAAHNIKE